MDSLKCRTDRALRLPAALWLATLLAVPAVLPAAVLDARPLPTQPARLVAESAARPGAATPKAWPQLAAPLALTTVQRKDDDRGLQTLTRLKFSALSLLLLNDRLEDWHRLESPARYAIEWQSRWSPGLIFGLAQLPTALFPPTLPQPAWDQYLRALRLQYGARLKLLVDDSSLKNANMSRPLAGGHTRVLDYVLAPEKPEQAPQRVIQIFMSTPGAVISAGWEGPVEVVERSQTAFASLLMSLEMATR
jgi:hypothetical protein